MKHFKFEVGQKATVKFLPIPVTAWRTQRAQEALDALEGMVQTMPEVFEGVGADTVRNKLQKDLEKAKAADDLDAKRQEGLG